jgi:hypothetical protein
VQGDRFIAVLAGLFLPGCFCQAVFASSCSSRFSAIGLFSQQSIYLMISQ